MTFETLEKANRIKQQIDYIEDALDSYKTLKKNVFGYEKMSEYGTTNIFIPFPKKCQDSIHELLKNELDLLKQEFKDLK